MNSLFRSLASLWRNGAVLLASLCLLAGQTGSAQTQKDETPRPPFGLQSATPKTGKRDESAAKQPPDKRELHLYRVKYGNANELATLLSTVYVDRAVNSEPLVRITADETGNRLLLFASAAHWNEIQMLIQKLDVEPDTGKEEHSLKLIPLGKGLAASDESLQSALNMMLAGNPTAKYAIDPARNVLIFNGDARLQAEVQRLCMALADAGAAAKEHAARARPTPTIQTRLLWLIDSEDKEGGTPLAGDLLKVVPVLAKLGFDHPRVMSNCMVTSHGGQFKTIGNTSFGQHGEAFVHLTGTCLVGDNNQAHLSVDLKINSGQDAKGAALKSLAALSTEIQAPLGHYVILGMTPTDGKTSAFVVQINVMD